jgi:hypothetical protein
MMVSNVDDADEFRVPPSQTEVSQNEAFEARIIALLLPVSISIVCSCPGVPTVTSTK